MVQQAERLITTITPPDPPPRPPSTLTRCAATVIKSDDDDDDDENIQCIVYNQNFSILLDFLQCGFRSTLNRRIYPTLCTKIFKLQKKPEI